MLQPLRLQLAPLPRPIDPGGSTRGRHPPRGLSRDAQSLLRGGGGLSHARLPARQEQNHARLQQPGHDEREQQDDKHRQPQRLAGGGVLGGRGLGCEAQTRIGICRWFVDRLLDGPLWTATEDERQFNTCGLCWSLARRSERAA